MKNIFVLSDGTLGNELKLLIGQKGYTLATDAGQSEVIVECLIADRQTKREALQKIAGETPSALILTSILNASTTEVASWLERPERVVGWAALPPLEKSKVIEVVNAQGFERAKVFFESLGKETVAVKDTVGGVLPRVVASLINGAAFAVMEGVASPHDIDQAMKLGTNYPLGPLEWGDRIGLDQVLGIMNALHEAHGERYRPAPLLVQMVQAKRKFYE